MKPKGKTLRYKRGNSAARTKPLILLGKTHGNYSASGKSGKRGNSSEAAPAGPSRADSGVRETPWWYDAAELLNAVAHGQEPTTAGADQRQVEDFRRVVDSRDRAECIVICLMRRELSQGDLDKGAPDKGAPDKGFPGNISFGGIRLNQKKAALHLLMAGVNDRLVLAQIDKANRAGDKAFLRKVARARWVKKVRPAVLDYERTSIVARFLVDYWCGDKPSNLSQLRFHSDLPPLCFFSNKALGDFVAYLLDMKCDAVFIRQIRKWKSRLRLMTVKTPKIWEVKETKDGLQDGLLFRR